MWALQAIAFVALLTIVVVRASFAWTREPRARISWLGALLGAAAILTLGILVPQEWMDELIGSTNLIKLVQNCLTFLAIWLTIQAAVAPPAARLKSLKWWVPFLVIVAFTATFLAIPERPTTRYLFVEEGAKYSTEIWLYGITHMVGIAIVAISLLFASRTQPGPAMRLFQIGSAAITLACLSEVVDLTLTRQQNTIPIVAAMFDPLFYAGVVTVAIGIITQWHQTRRNRYISISLAHELDEIAAARGADASVRLEERALPDARVHALRIAIEDAANRTGTALNPRERAALTRADSHLARDT